jgi:hypothetical protein
MARVDPFFNSFVSSEEGQGITVNPWLKVPNEPFGLVTRTSQTRSRGGPPLLTLTERVIVFALTTTILETVGAGPEPFRKLTVAP